MKKLSYRKLEKLLWEAHEKEAKRSGADFYNFGWGADEASIASKTSKGILQSDIDPETGKVTHSWNGE